MCIFLIAFDLLFTACPSDDIGVYYRKTLLTDEEKYRYLKYPWTPAASYKFPLKEMGNRKRSFQSSWLAKYPWLTYSPSLDGAFCRYCVLFGKKTGKNAGRLDKLYTSPLTLWTSASGKFNEHQEKSEFHKNAVIFAGNFMNVVDRNVMNVDEQLNKASQKIIEDNRDKLRPIIKTVIFCGKQNIALRGHRDDVMDIMGDCDKNCGNFLSMLKFRIDAGDTVLKTHLEACAGNARYTSKTIQNELIQVIGNLIQNQIVSEVKKAQYFSILADEATDSSNKEQLPLVIRFVDGGNNIREEFVGFFECNHGTSGQAVANLITEAVTELGLNLNDCVGQCYDGAGNMAGVTKGAAAIIRKTYPKAVYVHCASHRLNLCVMKSCQLQAVRNMMGTVGEISRYFEFSPKRQGLLGEQIERVCPKSKHKKLKDVCKTRWVQRLDSLEVFIELLLALTETLDEIRTNTDKHWNSESTIKANAFYHAICTFEFLMVLTATQGILAYTKGVTVKLQSSSIDAMKAYKDIEHVRTTVETIREDVDVQHKQWFNAASELAEQMDIDIKKPRTCGRQKHRENYSTVSPEDYYKQSVTIPFLDHLCQEINSRFSEGQSSLIKGFSGVPHVLQQEPDWKSLFRSFCQFIEEYMPDILCLESELTLWERHWESIEDKETIPKTVSEVLNTMDQHMYPNITAAMKVLATVPVTTCECERSVSTLRRLKTYMRSTMGQTRLTGLALLHTHYSMSICVDEVLNQFAILHPRRLKMTDILADK